MFKKFDHKLWFKHQSIISKSIFSQSNSFTLFYNALNTLNTLNALKEKITYPITKLIINFCNWNLN